ncbi:MAG TPA: hypothetical protein VKC53_02650 [Patescibacteria group bacterium]|nr:hypothetical protein [Patescibacteria group bacterium]
MTRTEDQASIFGKRIIPGKNGGFGVTGPNGATIDSFKNPVKEIKIPSELLGNLVGLVIEAFPDEFQGSEGQSREDQLTEGIFKIFPEEQAIEVANRTLPVLMHLGIDGKRVAREIMQTSEVVRTALKLDTMPKTDKDKMIERLGEVVSNHWPSSGKK